MPTILPPWPCARARENGRGSPRRRHRRACTSGRGPPGARTPERRPAQYRTRRTRPRLHGVSLLRRCGLLLIAQLATQDLADIGLRQIGPELDMLGHLVGGEVFAAETNNV